MNNLGGRMMGGGGKGLDPNETHPQTADTIVAGRLQTATKGRIVRN